MTSEMSFRRKKGERKREKDRPLIQDRGEFVFTNSSSSGRFFSKEEKDYYYNGTAFL